MSLKELFSWFQYIFFPVLYAILPICALIAALLPSSKLQFRLFLLLATLSGAVIGIFYVALSDAINKRKAQINREQ